MLEWAWLLGPLPAIICLISSDENSLIPTFFNTLFSSKLYVYSFKVTLGKMTCLINYDAVFHHIITNWAQILNFAYQNQI